MTFTRPDETGAGMDVTDGGETRAEMSGTAAQAIPARSALLPITLAACLIFWVFVFVDSGWGPVLSPLALQLHTSLSLTGLFYVTWSIGYLPGALVGGAMLDRYGPRRVLFAAALIIFCGLGAVYLGLLLFSTPLVILLGFAALAGIGGGVIDASTNGLISSLYASRRGSALNLFNLLYPLGGVIVALIDAGLLTLFHNDPRPAFVFTLCFTVGALFSLPGVPKAYRLTSAAPAARTEAPVPSPSLMRLLIPVILAMMLLAGVSSTIRAWAPAYLHVAFGQTPAIAAALSSIGWALSAISRLGAAALILRLGSWRMIMLGIGITLLGLVSVVLSPNAFLATLALAFTNIGLSPLFATCLAIGSERAGRSPGSVAGILLFASGISTVFCGWFFGYLLNNIGPLWAVVFCFVFVVCGGLLALRLRPPTAHTQHTQDSPAEHGQP